MHVICCMIVLLLTELRSERQADSHCGTSECRPWSSKRRICKILSGLILPLVGVHGLVVALTVAEQMVGVALPTPPALLRGESLRRDFCPWCGSAHIAVFGLFVLVYTEGVFFQQPYEFEQMVLGSPCLGEGCRGRPSRLWTAPWLRPRPLEFFCSFEFCAELCRRPRPRRSDVLCTYTSYPECLLWRFITPNRWQENGGPTLFEVQRDG
jgi:hypothetical protein